MGLAPSPLWEFFHKLSEFYGNNKTHYAAICKGCIESHITALENEDTEKLMLGTISERWNSGQLRTPSQNPRIYCKACTTPNGREAGMAWKRAQEKQPSPLPWLSISTENPSTIHTSPSPTPTPLLLVPPTDNIPTRRRSFSQIPPHPLDLDQAVLEQQLLCAIVSAGWSFLSVDDPEVIKLFSLVGIKLPPWKHLSGKVLDAEYNSRQEVLTQMMEGAYATGQCDGWKDTSVVVMFQSPATEWRTY
ncbi:uncharacterized protein EI90DRAFT_3012171 [Cantharellus anzutake]|uniref:uncharacterized protein n=1 Tax=Cantharellus anzutake TaxID=1750568 RepID=UPI00190563C9|nr:uncharacterized protein EI90DRAFT_3012171 [Cantharellus anzutake]KAF8341663.1 hypothetical protein EI90DRAFT_3012171 [Cantharellus anzutake]